MIMHKLLRRLRDRGGDELQELAFAMERPMPEIETMLAKMCERGFVARSKENGAPQIYKITPNGAALTIATPMQADFIDSLERIAYAVSVLAPHLGTQSFGERALLEELERHRTLFA